MTMLNSLTAKAANCSAFFRRVTAAPRSRRSGKLTDDDVELANGKSSELLGLLQTRYGRAKEQAEREIDLWIKQLK
jgi:uncharacterized protein YjbJ (UPF0337 family)